MSTLRALGSILAAAASVLGCKDLSAPDGGVAILVTPDTVVANRTLVPPGIQLTYHIRNVNSYVVAVSPCMPDVERETAPDVWEMVIPAADCFLEGFRPVRGARSSPSSDRWRPAATDSGPRMPCRIRSAFPSRARVRTASTPTRSS